MAGFFKHKSISIITVYSIAIFIATVSIVSFVLYSELSFPLSFNSLLGVVALLLVWHFGIKFPYLGLISMERLVQFHMLLIFPLFDTIFINMLAGFIMPFINKTYRLGSYYVAMLRGFSNAAMNGIMLLIAGLMLRYFTLLPLESLSLKSFYIIMLIALVMQFINIAMISVYHAVDNKNFTKLLNPALICADLIFVPIGVLSALLFQLGDSSYFYLFALFIVLILFSFNSMQMKNASPSHIFSGTKYQSDYFDIESVSKAMKNRLNNILSFDELYLGSFNQDFQALELYLGPRKSNRKYFTKDQLIELSKQPKLTSATIEVNNSDFAILSSPFINQNGNFAFICLLRKYETVYTTADMNLLQLFVQRHSMGLSYALTYKDLSEYKVKLEERVKHRTLALEKVNKEKSELVEELKELAHRDGLTGLYNRRVLDEMLLEFIERSVNSACLAVIDIDFFKNVNDEFGHEIGDKVLQQLANILNKNYAYGTEIIRYGGEEFVLLMDDLDYQVAIDHCLDLISQVSQYSWCVIAPGLKLTISIGLAQYPKTVLTQLFSEADKMLYEAKANGRNQLAYQH